MTSIKAKTLSKFEIKPVIAKGGEPDVLNIKGHELFPTLYANIGLLAKKKSGKTNVIYNILENVCGPKTHVHIYCSTVFKDTTYDAIMKMLKKKNISFEAHTSFIGKDGKTNLIKEVTSNEEDHEGGVAYDRKKKPLVKDKVGHQQLVDISGYFADKGLNIDRHNNRFNRELQILEAINKSDTRINDYAPRPWDGKRDRSKRDWNLVSLEPAGTIPFIRGLVYGDVGNVRPDIDRPLPSANDADEEDEPRRRASGKEQMAPEHVFVFDDLGKLLRHPSIAQLLKTNRHEHAKVIISSQYITDLTPESIKQLDYVGLFKAFGDAKLDAIYELLDLAVPLDVFKDLYNYATAAPFSFLYIDVRAELYRKNFSIQLDIESKGGDNALAQAKREERESFKKTKSKHGRSSTKLDTNAEGTDNEAEAEEPIRGSGVHRKRRKRTRK